MSYKSKLTTLRRKLFVPIIAALAVVSILSAYYAIVGNSYNAQWVCLLSSSACVGLVGRKVIFKKQR